MKQIVAMQPDTFGSIRIYQSRCRLNRHRGVEMPAEPAY